MSYLAEFKYNSISDNKGRLSGGKVFLTRVRSHDQLFTNQLYESDEKTRENSLLSIKPEESPLSILSKVSEESEIDVDFLSKILMVRIRQVMIYSACKIQKNFRRYIVIIRTKKQYLLMVLKNKISKNVTKLQSYVQKYIIKKNYGNIIKNLPKNYYLLIGDYTNSEISEPTSLKLIIYQTYFDREIMTYHDFFFSKILNKFFLFIKREFFEKNEYILVNFVADGHIFNNGNYRTLYKLKDTFYNVLSVCDLEVCKPRGRNFGAMSLPSRLLRTNYYSPKIKNIHFFLNKRKIEKRVSFCPIANSNENLKLIRNTSILKPTSRNVSVSTKSSKKSVKFSDLVYESC